jgi:hypothetical protein
MAGDDETRVTTLTLLAPALALAGRLDDSWRAFALLESLCLARHDHFHLGVCYGNRLQYWAQCGAIEPALDDLRRSVALAREVGHFKLERVALHSLAELLHWSGEAGEAEPLARRARDLQLRYLDRHVPEDILLLARILVARGERAEAAALLAAVRAASAEDIARTRSRQLLVALVERATSTFAESPWQALLDDLARELPLDEHLEALWLAIRDAPPAIGETWRRRAAALAADHPRWLARFRDPTAA